MRRGGSGKRSCTVRHSGINGVCELIHIKLIVTRHSHETALGFFCVFFTLLRYWYIANKYKHNAVFMKYLNQAVYIIAYLIKIN